LDLHLYRDLQELKMTVRLSPRRQASSSSIESQEVSRIPSLAENKIKHLTTPLKLVEVSMRDSSKATCDVDPLSRSLSEELNSKVKVLINRLEVRERELLAKCDFDAVKLCQLSRRNFVQFVEMFCGERIGRKDCDAMSISEMHVSRDATIAKVGSGGG
jgi:ribosome-binding factor A